MTIDVKDARIDGSEIVQDPVGHAARGMTVRPTARATVLERARRLVRNPKPQLVVDDASYDDVRTSSGVRWGRITFIAFVLVPSIVAALYLAFIAADQYVAETRFVVRLGPQEGGGGLSGLSSVISAATGGGGMSGTAAAGGGGSNGAGTATENAHIVTSYIHSPTIVDDLLTTTDLRAVFTRPEADIYARLKRNATIDELRLYWNQMVNTYVDMMSGIVTVEVRAFRPDDAVLLATRVEALSEKLVNEISDRARADALRRASAEVDRAQGLVVAAIKDMEQYRNSEGLIDPIQSASDSGKLLSRVLLDELTAENQLFVARSSLSADAPSVRILQTQIENLKKQAATLRAQMTGSDSDRSNLAASFSRFEQVAIKEKMAESMYTLAESGLDRARRMAEAQSVYLTAFVPARLPEDYTFPKRFETAAMIALACLVIWGILSLIVASVEDHRMS